MKRIALIWSTVWGDNTVGGGKRFIPASPWLPGPSVKIVKGIWELAQIQTNGSVCLAFQVANVENAPGAITEIDTALTAVGMSYGTVVDISATTGSKALVRFVWNVWNSSAATLVMGRAGGSVDYDSCA